ncbi:MAG: hypothetical protein ACK5LK_05005 [Chthoniobacterales bacterium]
MIWYFLGALLLVFLGSLRAEEKADEEIELPVLFSHSHDSAYTQFPSHAGVGESGVNFIFAVPNRPSLISLGVYDAEQNLVKTLAEGKREDEFPLGLNGLLAVWDATLQDGSPAPPGHYVIRGYAITLPDWEGISYENHPWVEVFGPAVAIDSLRAFGLVSSEDAGNGDLVGLGKKSGGDLLFRASFDGRVKWTRELPSLENADEVDLVLPPAGGAKLALQRGKELQIFNLETGEPLDFSEKKTNLVLTPGERIAAMTRGKLFFIDFQPRVDKKSRELHFENMEFLHLPGNLIKESSLTALSFSGDRSLLLSASGKIYLAKFSDFFQEAQELSFPKISFTRRIAWGMGDRFWALYREGVEDEKKDFFQLGEFSVTGDFLKRLVNSDDGSIWQLKDFSITGDGEFLCVLSETPNGGMRLSGLQSGNAEQGWKMLLGIYDDEKKQNGNEAVAGHSAVVEHDFIDEMTGKPARAYFSTRVNPSGDLEMLDASGLKLATLGADVSWRSSRLRSVSGELYLQLNTDFWQENYRLFGLENIGLIEAVEIDWPPRDDSHSESSHYEPK